MKKLLILSALILALTSCEKETEYCWKCNHETFFENGYTSFMIEVCGMTYEQRENYEKSNTMLTGSVKKVTNCKLAQ